MRTRLITWAARAAALTLAFHLLAFPAVSAKAKEEPTTEPSEETAPPAPVHLQLLSFVAPIEPPTEEGQDAISITVLLDVGTEERIAKVCRQSPRLRNAILEDLYAVPIRFGPDNKLDLAAVGPRLVAACNRALGADLVVDATVLSGPRGLGGGTGQKLPFGRILGCSEVKESKGSKGAKGAAAH